MRKCFIGLFFLPFAALSQSNTYNAIDKYMQEIVRSKEFSGVVRITEKGKIIYNKAFGLANREWNIANTLDTKFRIGSNTKQFTAAAILQLVDQGKIDLNDKLIKYFPGYPKGDSVTIRMLLNHTSGIKNYGNGPASVFTLPLSRDSVVSLFKNQPYDFTPGTRWRYNNSAYFLLGYIIEKVSGKSYGTYLQESLMPLAKMQNSGLNNLDSIIEKRAVGYIKTRSGWKNAPYMSMEIPFSAGAMYSTAEDLYKWNMALQSGKIISMKQVKEMNSPALYNYGLGARIDSFYNHKRIGHGGSIPGFESHSVWFPESELSVIVLSNNESDVNFIAEDLEGVIFKKPAVVIDALLLDAYAGRYTAGNTRFTFARKGKTFNFMDGEESVELYPVSQNSFVYGFSRRRYFTFIKMDDGRMKLQLTRNGAMSEFYKE